MNTRFLSLVTILMLSGYGGPLAGQEKIQVKTEISPEEIEAPTERKKTSIMDWMMDLETSDVTLSITSDFQHFRGNRRYQEYQVAVVSIDRGAQHLEQEAEIKPRGKYRCMRCDLPPVKIKFDKDTLKEVGLSKMNELKIVLPCKADEQYKAFLNKEFLVYRLYNVLTERSYRVQPITLNIHCTQTGEKVDNLEAFLIEHEEELVKRVNGKATDTVGVGPLGFSGEDYLRLQVFQFMIGNTDWIPPTQHNFELIEIKGVKGLVPVPFDFDFSGIVATDYAVPSSMTKLQSVQDRFFMGNGYTEAELEKGFGLFREKRPELIAVIESSELIDKKEKKKMIKYIESFFGIIDDPEAVRTHFIDRPAFMPKIY